METHRVFDLGDLLRALPRDLLGGLLARRFVKLVRASRNLIGRLPSWSRAPVAGAGGGVDGIFFSLVVLGTLTGSAFGRAVTGSGDTLCPLIGLAAFVGAGYRTPVAAVAFVAETPGSPWALIPAMVATVVGYLAIGSEGISESQRPVSG